MRLFDLHCDTLHELLQHGEDVLQNQRQVDLSRGVAFSPWYQCFALWVKDGTSSEAASARIAQLLQLALKFERSYPTLFHILRSRKELFSLPQTPCTAVLTVENGGVAAGGDAVPDAWISAGVKMVSLTWNAGNRWGEGCGGDPKRGLTPSGAAAVKKMERNGIVVDLSHANRRTFWDVCRISARPLAVSHTASASVKPSARALNDMQFMTLRDHGGIVGLDLCADHLGGPPLERFLPHLEHFLSLGGRSCIALGCDLDGVDIPPEHNGIRILTDLYDRLLQRNYTEALIDDLFFDNAHRFFKRCIR